MSLGTILLVILILALVGVLPTWPHGTSWGYGPGGLVGIFVIVVVVLFATGSQAVRLPGRASSLARRWLSPRCGRRQLRG